MKEHIQNCYHNIEEEYTAISINWYSVLERQRTAQLFIIITVLFDKYRIVPCIRTPLFGTTNIYYTILIQVIVVFIHDV